MYVYQTKSKAITIKRNKPIPKVTQRLLGLKNIPQKRKGKGAQAPFLLSARNSLLLLLYWCPSPCLLVQGSMIPEPRIPEPRLPNCCPQVIVPRTPKLGFSSQSRTPEVQGTRTPKQKQIARREVLNQDERQAARTRIRGIPSNLMWRYSHAIVFRCF